MDSNNNIYLYSHILEYIKYPNRAILWMKTMHYPNTIRSPTYYKLSYDLLPPYFNKYIEIIEQKPARDLRFQYIHAPLVKPLYAECSPLFQLIKLINSLRNDPNDIILKKFFG